MSKESVLEFVKLAAEDPKIFDEAKKYQEEGDLFKALSKVAKEKGLECSPKEIEEAMDTVSKLGSGEFDEGDLENVAGGNWLGDQFKKLGDYFKKAWNESGASDSWNKLKSAWGNLKDGFNFLKNFKK